MDVSKFIGFRLHEVTPILDAENLSYNVVEVWDTKNTKMGDDLRVINIKNDEMINIYVAYF